MNDHVHHAACRVRSIEQSFNSPSQCLMPAMAKRIGPLLGSCPRARSSLNV